MKVEGIAELADQIGPANEHRLDRMINRLGPFEGWKSCELDRAGDPRRIEYGAVAAETLHDEILPRST